MLNLANCILHQPNFLPSGIHKKNILKYRRDDETVKKGGPAIHLHADKLPDKMFSKADPFQIRTDHILRRNNGQENPAS